MTNAQVDQSRILRMDKVSRSHCFRVTAAQNTAKQLILNAVKSIQLLVGEPPAAAAPEQRILNQDNQQFVTFPKRHAAVDQN